MFYLYCYDVKQVVLSFILPKRQDDLLFLELPYLVNEKIDKWIIDKSRCDIFLETNMKYTFWDSIVDRYINSINRYNLNSRSLNVKFGTMFYGINKR